MDQAVEAEAQAEGPVEIPQGLNAGEVVQAMEEVIADEVVAAEEIPVPDVPELAPQAGW